MYLISIYFDDKTNRHIRNFIKQVAKKTGNTYMIDGNVPPHITISAFETQGLEAVISNLDNAIQHLESGKLIWASISAFLPSVIYLAPVLNSYLQVLSEQVYESIKDIEGIRIRPKYQPFSWMPHTTIGKKLTPEELRIAFEVIQNSFGMFEGEAIKIGLAKTNPYEDIKVWKLGGVKK